MDDMSVEVDIDRISDELANFTFAYLVTVGDDYHAHTVAVEPVLADGALTVPPSRAVLQRKAAPGGAKKPGCKDDCLPLEKR